MTDPRKRKLAWLLWAAPVAVVAIGASVHGAGMMAAPPADLDYARTQASEKGLFTASIAPGIEPVAINQMHSWTVGVVFADGGAVAPSAIRIDGGMPQHGHGLPTAPQVTADLGDGKFTVEGMKFNMPGWWVVKVEVDTADGTDTATFNLAL